MTEANITEEELAPAPPEREPRSLFKYSAWVHTGAGAEECTEYDEDAGTNACGDKSHFHAWCRLPNPFQHREIRERALAAKARKLRQLRNAGTDAFDILEGDLDAIALRGDEAISELADELLQRDWWKDYLVAAREIKDINDEGEGAEEDEKRFAHVEEDQARYARLEATDPAKRNEDEHTELRDHLAEYAKLVDERLNAIVNPKREQLEGLDINALIDKVRAKRIETEVQQEFMHHFSMNEWLACTFTSPEGDTYFRDLSHLERAAPEVIRALQEVYGDLERTAQEAQGN